LRLLLIGLGVTLALSVAPPAPAPLSVSSTDFVRLFTQYRTGDADAAVAEFASWDRVRVERDAAIDLPPGDLRAQAALALFHTEAGIRNGQLDLLVSSGTTGQDVIREPHGTAAGRWIDGLTPKAIAAHDSKIVEFVRTWLIVQASVAERWGRSWHVSPATNTSLPPIADDAEWLMLRGAWFEKYAGPRVEARDRYSYSRDPVGDNPLDALTTPNGVFDGKRVQEAEDCFKRVIARQPSLVEARLRLGHLYATVNRRRDAARELEAAFAASADPNHVFVHYLAALFLGRVFEDDGDRANAERMYEAAVHADPQPASAHVALAMLELRGGRSAEGWAAARAVFDRPADAHSRDADPVSLYPDGEFWQLSAKLQALRGLVRP
jgi:tetratricopeptide (TPR) repeat protein